MFSIVLSLLAIVACTAGFAPRTDDAVQLFKAGRIVGGSQVSINNYPFQVSVQFINSHVCGGSIIARHWLLTAATCIRRDFPQSLHTFRVGSSNHNSGGVLVSADGIWGHGLFNEQSLDYDIAVVSLGINRLTFQTGIHSIDLVDANTVIPSGTMATASGWGVVSEGGQISNELRAVHIPVVSNAVCKAAYQSVGLTVTDRMLCAGYSSGGYDSCTGDAGGPLITTEGQIGIVSWGHGCGRPGYYGVYTSIPKLRDWIRTVTFV